MADTPQTIEPKKEFLLKHKIALWDVLESCDISGASDASIKKPIANNVAAAIEGTRIKRIYTTGKTANQLLKKLCGIEGRCLPSPSPANCAVSFDRLVEEYGIIKTRS